MRHSDVSICGRSAAALLGACLCLGVAESASAALIPNAITGVTGTAYQGGDSLDPGNGSISRALDGTGLTVGNVNDSSTWTHDNGWQNSWAGYGPDGGANSYTGNSTAGAWFVADLQSSHSNLNDLWIWNDNQATVTNRGAQLVDIYYATSPTTPVTGSSYSFGSGWTLLQNDYTIPQASGGTAATYNAVIDLSGITAQYIGFDILTSYGGKWAGGNGYRVGFSEIQFTTEVPEPSAIAALAAGGLLLAAGRRRKRAR